MVTYSPAHIEIIMSLNEFLETGFLFVDDIFIRLGSLYTLYLLYETQPYTPKIKVPVSIGTIILLSCPYIKDMLFIL
jgi:hypothetical protein